MVDTQDVKTKMDRMNPLSKIDSQNWQAILGLGVGLLIIGLLMLIYPKPSLWIVTVLIGATALFMGLFGVISYFTAKGENRNIGWLLLGLVGVAFGIILFAYPGMSVTILMFLWGLWLIFSGITLLFAGLIDKDTKDTKILMILGGMLSLIIGGIFVVSPFDGAVALIWIIGLFTLVYGLIFITLAIRLYGSMGKKTTRAK